MPAVGPDPAVGVGARRIGRTEAVALPVPAATTETSAAQRQMLVLEDWRKPSEHRTYLANGFAVIGLAMSIMSVILQRPELMGIAAPFILTLVLGVMSHRPDTFSASLELDTERGVEGDQMVIAVELRSEVGVPRADIELELPYRFAPTETLRALVSVPPGATKRVEFPVELAEWGVAKPNALTVKCTGRFGLLTRRYRFRCRGQVRISLPDERMRSLLDPDRFRRVVGSHDSPDRGEGIEIADVRPYRPGDPLKSLNWRISNRRQEPWITVRHPDRSTTLVVVVDAHVSVGEGAEDCRRRAARAAVALARTHIQVHDRVGLLIVGRGERWLQPQLGTAQMHRISDALLDVTADGAAGSRVVVQAGRVVPLDAVVVVVSSLADQRTVSLIGDLRSRGRSVSVLQPELSRLSDEGLEHRQFHEEADRLFELDLEVARRYLQERGVAVMPWQIGQPVEVALEGMRKLKRASRAATT